MIGVRSEQASGARLRFANGTVLEDKAEEGIFLFMTEDPVRIPIAIEITDGTGAMLAAYEEFRGL